MACRETRNLFNKHCRPSLWAYLHKRKRLPVYFWKDSFAWMVCFFIGHKKELLGMQDDLSCSRCGTYLRWAVKTLRQRLRDRLEKVTG